MSKPRGGAAPLRPVPPVRAERMRLGLSQAALAARVGVTTDSITRIEQGWPPVPPATLARVLAELSIAWPAPESTAGPGERPPGPPPRNSHRDSPGPQENAPPIVAAPRRKR